MSQPVRGIARSLLIPAVFAAVALTGQQAASAAAPPAAHFSAQTDHHFLAPNVYFAAQISHR